MSAPTKQPCKHCGVLAIPVQHRCGGKQEAIDAAYNVYVSRTHDRPSQRWTGTGWVKRLV